MCFQQPQHVGQKEQNVLDMVLRTTPPGNPEAVLDAIDNYGWSSDFLMNIGDRKGAILDKALHKRQPQVRWQFLLGNLAKCTIACEDICNVTSVCICNECVAGCS